MCVSLALCNCNLLSPAAAVRLKGTSCARLAKSKPRVSGKQKGERRAAMCALKISWHSKKSNFFLLLHQNNNNIEIEVMKVRRKNSIFLSNLFFSRAFCFCKFCSAKQLTLKRQSFVLWNALRKSKSSRAAEVRVNLCTLFDSQSLTAMTAVQSLQCQKKAGEKSNKFAN